MAGAKVKTKMARFAAEMLEASVADLVFENGTIAVKGAPTSAKKFADVARSPTFRYRCPTAWSRD
jgi:CO/xanthine dehydrogenase Mo-binding subunit